MQVEITLKNYRCFADSKPARFVLRDGFTAFVGVNNAGKSSLLKFFFEFRPIFALLSDSSSNYNHFRAALQDRVGFSKAPSLFDLEEMFCNTNDRDLVVQLMFADGFADGNTLPIPKRLDLTMPRGTNQCIATLHLTDGPLDTKGAKMNFQGTTLLLEGTPKVELANLFQVFQTLTKILYIGPFRNAINVGSKQDYFDIKVGQAFIQSWQYLKTGNTIKESEATYRLTEDIKRIFGFKGLEINSTPSDQTLQVFIDGKSYKLPELGSGITQFVLVLANAATKKPSFILIDEPELNLHPSLQLDFLTTLGSYADKGVLFCTHSIGLARASADYIYSVRNDKRESEVCVLEATPQLSEFLGELSFSGYRELGFDKVLLVEGATDVRTIQQFLRLYRKDHQIVLLPLGGSSLIRGSSDLELGEIKRITENVFALIDSERISSESPLPRERAEFAEICNKNGIKCHILERRAIENYFTDYAVKEIKGDKYRALGPYQPLEEASPKWSKTENWKIAREMTIKDVDKTDLGVFLKSI